MAAALQQPAPAEAPTSGPPITDGSRKDHHQKGNVIDESSEESRTLSPAEIAEDSKQKGIGTSSKDLCLGDFELIKTLGTGTFARVWLARLHHPSAGEEGKVYALKILRKVDVIRLKQVEHVRNERNTLAAVSGHPFITTLITSFADSSSLYMLLDYCPGGEVFSYLRRARRFNEPTSRFYAAEIVLILEYLHNVQGVAYRDLKPENILIDAEGHLKLVDFGFAKKVGSPEETYTLCGTPEYLAPEVIRNKGHGTAVDWWALGILIYEFIVGQPPFWDQNPMKIYEQIVQGHLRFPHGISREARDLICGLCVVNPSQRLGNISGGSERVKAQAFFHGVDWDALYFRKIKGPIIPKLNSESDTSNFDEYDAPTEPSTAYTEEMAQKYEEYWKDF
ncbi:MAG: serine/threonine protein kinase, AGC [Cirrosporium novae-zelandiae]|nr:MAG: serine/threonine protein kinase, AGC [Cirrosporium novae-zelandiae]